MSLVCQADHCNQPVIGNRLYEFSPGLMIEMRLCVNHDEKVRKVLERLPWFQVAAGPWRGDEVEFYGD